MSTSGRQMDDPIEYWRLVEELTVREAALLVVGCDPSFCNDQEAQERGYETMRTAISKALLGNLIQGRVVPLRGDRSGFYSGDHFGEILEPVGHRFRDVPEILDPVDPVASTVKVDSLKSWLDDRGLQSDFFLPNRDKDAGDRGPDCLNKDHPHYAPKLAAAVKVWEALATGEVSRKSPKKRSVEKLRGNATKWGLTTADGKPNNTAIDEIAKVVNWRPKGGAPKTGK